jgi:hypothetical protein
MRLKAVFFLLLFAITWTVNGQKGHLGPIQLSGVVVTQEKGQPVKMPYVTIAVEGQQGEPIPIGMDFLFGGRKGRNHCFFLCGL